MDLYLKSLIVLRKGKSTTTIPWRGIPISWPDIFTIIFPSQALGEMAFVTHEEDEAPA
jgi:hypothetical protein